MFAAINKWFADRRLPPSHYEMYGRCNNCRRIVSAKIPTGTLAKGFGFPCPNCGVELRVKETLE